MNRKEKGKFGTKGILLLVVLGLALLLATLKLYTAAGAEPSYDAKSLERWIAIYNASAFLSPNSSDAMTAERAVRKIGTNGLPVMLKWIRYKPPFWRQSANRVLAHMPVTVSGIFRDRKLEKSYAAREGFKILGPVAAPAVPALTQIIFDPHAGRARDLAIDALGAIGTNGLPSLLREAADTHAPSREEAIIEIAKMQESGVSVEQAAPVLLQYVPSDGYIAEDAGNILFKLAEHSPAVTALLVSNLDNTNEMMQLGAVEVLGAIGTNATSTAPALAKLLNSPDERLRLAASNALQLIEPEKE